MRVVRWSSRTPRDSSSRSTARLADDFGMPSEAPAAVKLPVSTTREKTETKLRSIPFVAVTATKLSTVAA